MKLCICKFPENRNFLFQLYEIFNSYKPAEGAKPVIEPRHDPLKEREKTIFISLGTLDVYHGKDLLKEAQDYIKEKRQTTFEEHLPPVEEDVSQQSGENVDVDVDEV